MHQSRPHIIFAVAFFAATILTAFAQAQSVVFVSAKTGADGNPCTSSAPCRTISFAHGAVTANGRIVINDSGDYSEFTITKSVTVETAPGVAAVIVSQASPTLVAVLAGAADKVVIRGLRIKGNGTNTFGIRCNSGGSLVVDDCTVEGMTNAGLSVTGATLVALQKSSLRNNATGINFNLGSAGTQSAAIENCLVERSTNNGIIASTSDNGNLRLVIRSSRLFNNGGAGLRAIAGLSNAFVDVVIENSAAIANGTGLHAERIGTSVRVSNTTIVGNNLGLFTSNLANILTRVNNTLEGNSNNGSFSEFYVAQ